MKLNIVGHTSADLIHRNGDVEYIPGGGVYYGILALESVQRIIQNNYDRIMAKSDKNSFDAREDDMKNITIIGTITLALKYTHLFRDVIKKYKINKVASKTQTIFENIYESDRRVQILHEISDPIPLSQIFNADVHILTPITQQDFGFEFTQLTGILCLDIQGLVRRMDENKTVYEVYDNLPSFENITLIKLNIQQLSQIFKIDDIHSDAFMEIPIKFIIVTNPTYIYLKYDNQFYELEHQRYKCPTGHGDIILCSFVLLQVLGYGPKQTLEYIVKILDEFFTQQ